MNDKPHGPTSERFMRHHCGASGLVRDDTNTNYEGRYQVVHASFWWRIKVGDGGVPYGRFYTKHEAEKMAALLLREFRNGIYVGQQSILVEP